MGTLHLNPVLLSRMKHGGGTVSGYGYLYNWYAASDTDFAPTGWHVPTSTEILALIAMFESPDEGGHLKEIGLSHWTTPNTGADNSSGLTLLGTGIRNEIGYINRTLMYFAWASDEYNAVNGSSITCAYNNSNAAVSAVSKFTGSSVRLIKDDSTDPGTMTDPDGNIYTTVKIGSQVWIAQDYRSTKKGNGVSVPIVADQSAWNALTTPGYCIYP